MQRPPVEAGRDTDTLGGEFRLRELQQHVGA